MERARLQLLQRYVGNRTLARYFDKGFWIVESDGTYTWHQGTDATGFVPSGLPNYKSPGSWFEWPVYRRPAAAPTVSVKAETPVVESQAVPAATATPESQAVPAATVTPESQAVPAATVTPETQAVPAATATPQAHTVPQPSRAAPAPAIDYDTIGEAIVALAIRKFKQNYQFSGPEVRVSECTRMELPSLDAQRVFAATRTALSGLNPGTVIFGKKSNQKFTAAGGGERGNLGGHKGRNFNIKVKKVDKAGKARLDAAEAQIHVTWT